MVVGGLMGRIVGHLVQWLVLVAPNRAIFGNCATRSDGTCIQPGVYGLIAAGATMCGVTRLSVTLAVILFELTGSLDYVLPFSLAVLVAKWTADAVEPCSIYDLLTSMNSYPFLDNKHKPVFTGDLADIVPRVRRERVIDITNSPLVEATKLRAKLEILHRAGELDGGLPIVRQDVLVGLIPAPDLEYALDQLADEQSSLCLMDRIPSIDEDENEEPDPTDFTRFIDPVGAPNGVGGGGGRRCVEARALTGTAGAGDAGHSVAHGPRVRVLRQAWTAIHLRVKRRQICRHGERGPSLGGPWGMDRG